MRTTDVSPETFVSPKDRTDSVRATLKVLALVLFNVAVIYMAWTVVSDKADLNRPADQPALTQTLGSNS